MARVCRLVLIIVYFHESRPGLANKNVQFIYFLTHVSGTLLNLSKIIMSSLPFAAIPIWKGTISCRALLMSELCRFQFLKNRDFDFVAVFSKFFGIVIEKELEK